MGVFKLDLMTLLVLFVVLSVVVTMTAGSKEGNQNSVGQVIPKAPVSTVNKMGTANTDSSFRVAPVAISNAKFVSKTWN